MIRILTLKSYKISDFFFLLLINTKEYKHLSPRECQNTLLPGEILK